MSGPISGVRIVFLTVFVNFECSGSSNTCAGTLLANSFISLVDASLAGSEQV